MSPESFSGPENNSSKSSKKKEKARKRLQRHLGASAKAEEATEKPQSEEDKKRGRELLNFVTGNPEKQKTSEKKRSKDAEKLPKPVEESTEPVEPMPLSPELERLQKDVLLAVDQETAAADKSDTAEKEAESKPLKSSKETDVDLVEAVEAADADQADETAEVDAEHKPDTSEQAISYELQPNQMTTGETIIDLNGPVAEHVIPLRPEQAVEIPPIFQGRIQGPIEELRAQPEQQQQQQMDPEQGEPLDPNQDPASAQNSPNTPLPVPASNQNIIPAYGNVPPLVGNQVPINPNLQTYPQTQNPNVLPTSPAANPNVFTQRDIEEAEYYARKAGMGQGLLVGAVAGGAYEHFKHKGREKEAEKRFKEQTKQLKQSREDHNFELAEQARHNAEQNRQLTAAEKRATQAEQRFSAETSYNPSERQIQGPERQAGIPTTTEKRFAAEKVPEKQRVQAERNPELPEQLEVPTDHRLEQSAWHTIEVDAKTGKPVESPTFEYGQEYHHERAQETRFAAQHDDPAKQAAASAIGSAVGGSMASSGSSSNSQSHTNVPSASTQGSPSSVKQKAQAGLNNLSKQAASAGPVWPLALAFVVLVLLILILL